MKSKTVFLVLLFLLAGGLYTFAYHPVSVLFERPGWWVYDFLQRNLPAEKPGGVALIEIDDGTLEQIYEDSGIGFPWPREVYAGLFEVSQLLKAKAISFDILFDRPSTYGLEDDQIFNEALRKIDIPVVFPAPMGRILPPSETLVENFDGLKYGAVTPPPEVDGVYRVLPQKLKEGDEEFNSLGYASIQAAFPDVKFPEKTSAIPVHFYRPQDMIRVPFYNLMRAYYQYQENGKLPAEIKELENKLWFVGYTAAALYDIKPMPFSRKASGVDLHVHGAANLLNNDYLQVINPNKELMLFVSLLLIGLIVLAYVQTPVSSLGLTLSFSLGVPLVLCIILWTQKVWFNPFAMGIQVSAFLGAFFSIRYQREFKERGKYAQLLANSMSQEMLELVQSGEMQVTRFGERRDITICFSDLSGFTTIAESMPPQELVELLNEYLDEVVDVIFKHNGYVDKFIGDAVMALWGAPIEGQNDHAKLGLQTLLDFEKAVDRFNEKARKRLGEDCPKFIARVGLHTGEAIVGNIGSQNRYNYTAIGDSVNLAARLESMGKKYDVLTLVSEEVLKAMGLNEHPDLIFIDEVMVKGKNEPTKIYTEKLDLSPEEVQSFSQGFSHYCKEEWKEAIEALRSLDRFGPSRVIISRCELALTGDKPAQFNKGVWSHDSK